MSRSLSDNGCWLPVGPNQPSHSNERLVTALLSHETSGSSTRGLEGWPRICSQLLSVICYGNGIIQGCVGEGQSWRRYFVDDHLLLLKKAERQVGERERRRMMNGQGREEKTTQ